MRATKEVLVHFEYSARTVEIRLATKPHSLHIVASLCRQKWLTSLRERLREIELFQHRPLALTLLNVLVEWFQKAT